MRAAGHLRLRLAALSARELCLPPPVTSSPLCSQFAAKQFRTDVFGFAIGTCVYLSLIPSLARLRRLDLVGSAIALGLHCLWPLALAQSKRTLAFIQRHRDYLLMFQ